MIPFDGICTNTGSGNPALIEPAGAKLFGGVEHVVLLHRVVVDVGVVRERQRADAVAAAQHGLVVQAVGRAGARTEVLQVLLHADALAHVAVAGDLQRVGRRIVVRQRRPDRPGR